MIKQRNWILVGFLLLTFAIFFLFYTASYPIFPTDMDDWAYLYPRRAAVPIWKSWNPIRVFAEVAMPAVSMASSLMFRPLTGNIFSAMMIGFALCMASAMTALTGALWRMLQEKSISVSQIVFWVSFFLLSHFWIFRTEYQHNSYMLRTSDACTYFFYVIPNLMNSIAVLWMESDLDLRTLTSSNGFSLKKSIFFLLCYFCIFSNIWAGMILAAYLGSILVIGTASALRKKKRFRIWFTENSMVLLLLALWLLSQVFELNGYRAREVTENRTLEIRETILLIPSILRSMNRRYLITTGVLLLGGLAALLRSKDRSVLHMVGIWTLAGFFCVLYLILSCAKVAPSYIRRPDVFYGLFFFLTVIVLMAGSALVKRVSFLKLVMPLVLVIILSDCNSPGRTWGYSTVHGISPRIVNNINNDIVDQLKEAERNCMDSVRIFIPKMEGIDNGLYNVRGNEIVGETMWKLGVLEKNIIVEELVPSEDKNYLLETGPLS